MKIEKIIGSGLLALGLSLILGTVYYMYQVFTGIMGAPGIFVLKDIVVSASMQGQLSSIQMVLVPGDVASKGINMGVWYMLMGFLASAGSRIAYLGVQLVREIKLEMKTASPKELP